MKNDNWLLSAWVRKWWNGRHIQGIFWFVMLILIIGVLAGTFLEWTVGKPTADEAGIELPHSTLVKYMKARNTDEGRAARVGREKE